MNPFIILGFLISSFGFYQHLKFGFWTVQGREIIILSFCFLSWIFNNGDFSMYFFCFTGSFAWLSRTMCIICCYRYLLNCFSFYLQFIFILQFISLFGWFVIVLPLNIFKLVFIFYFFFSICSLWIQMLIDLAVCCSCNYS